MGVVLMVVQVLLMQGARETVQADMKIYFHDEKPGDQREDHDSGNPVSEKQLEDLGLHYFYYPDKAAVDELALQRSYKNRDEVNIRPATFGSTEAYLEKLKIFYEEHLHEDEEIRYILDGRGFFDVRDRNDKWIRCAVEKGDLLILPPGIYHRFTTDSSDYIKAMRLFQDEPKWVPYARPADEKPARQEYLHSLA